MQSCCVCSSLAPGCRRYTAVLKYREASGAYLAVHTPQVLADQILDNRKLRMFAVPPDTGTNNRHLVSNSGQLATLLATCTRS